MEFERVRQAKRENEPLNEELKVNKEIKLNELMNEWTYCPLRLPEG